MFRNFQFFFAHIPNAIKVTAVAATTAVAIMRYVCDTIQHCSRSASESVVSWAARVQEWNEIDGKILSETSLEKLKNFKKIDKETQLFLGT